MVEIPDTLVERLKARQVVLITGLGCSELTGAPGWKVFTESLASRLVFSDAQATAARLIAAGRIGDALAMIRDMLPPNVLEEALRQAFPDGVELPEGIRQAAQFPWRAVVTTSFDDLWERAMSSPERADPLRVMVGTEATAAARYGGPGSPLMHLCGRTAQPKSLCLGPADARTRLVPSAGLGWLEQLRRRRTLVFLGFRPTDPDLVWLASWMAARPAEGGPHYLFLDVSGEPEPDAEELLWTLRTGLEVLPCMEGTAEALARLTRASVPIAAQLAPSDAEIDLDQWLDRWARDPADPQPRQILARAEVALRDEERWDRLVELLLRRLDLQDDRHQQVAALGEVAKIFREKLAAPERALTAGVVMLRLLPTDDDLWEKLRGDARAGGAWKQLVAEATLVAKEEGATPGAARIWRELARVERDELGRPEEALTAYKQALAAEPGRRETRDAQADLLRELGRWDELVAVLRASADESDDPLRAVAPLLEAAEVLETSLGEMAGAIAAYEGALAIAPESESTVLALERLYESERRWADLATLLDRRADRASGADATTFRRRRAEILADHLDALDLAAEELEALVEADPADRAALLRLEQTYRRADRYDDVLRVLRRQADTAPSVADRLALLRRLAVEGETRPEGRDRGAEALEEILRLEPRDAEAFTALVRIDRAAGRWPALAEVLSRRLDVTETAEARRELLFTLAETYERHLGDADKALEFYTAAEAAGDQREETHEAIVRLAQRLERWRACTDALVRWADMAGDAELRAGLLLEAAGLLYERLEDGPATEAALGRVLADAPSNAKALALLARVRRAAGDRDRAVQLLQQAAAGEPDAREQARLLVEAARALEEEEGQDERLIDLYTRALAADPAQVTAGERLVEIQARRGAWAEVQKLLDAQLQRADPADAERLAALQARLGEACLEAGDDDKALSNFEKAYAEMGYAQRPEALPLLLGYGELSFVRGDWKQAAEIYGALLRMHGQALPATEVRAAMLRLGRAEAELGNQENALRIYREARTLDPTHRPTLEALCGLAAARGDWSAWVTEREALAQLSVDVEPSQRAGLWEEIGDSCLERLADATRAEAAYRQSLGAEAGRRSVLHKLLDLYTKGARWQPAIEILEAIAKVETDRALRARTLYMAAQLYEQELGRSTEAAALLERCLDDAPDMIAAFDELEKLREQAGDWQALAASYQAMLGRLPANAPVETRLRLWTRLADVALQRLRDRKLALSALEEAAALDPADVPRQEALAHLYDLSGPDVRDKAIAAHQRLIAGDPHRTDSYLALAKLYGEMGDVDKQWCVASALWYLKKTNAALEIVFRRHRPPQTRAAQQPFTDDIWRRVLHPDEDQALGEMLLLAAPYLSAPTAQDPNALGLGRQHQIDVSTADPGAPARAFLMLAGTLGLPKSDLYQIEGEGGQTTICCLQGKAGPRAALVLGPPTLRRTSFDLMFDLASHMSYLRPDRFLKFALRTPAALAMGLEVVLALAGVPGFKVGDGEAGQLAAYLQRSMPGPVAERLTEVGRELVEARGEAQGAVDPAKWMAATDLSAARLALAVTGDLGAAFRVISGEAIPTSTVPIHRRMADLVAFSISEDYFACRRHLGLTVA